MNNKLHILDRIQRENKSVDESYPMTVLIPSWNNLDILKLCIRSIQENSHFKLQIIIIVNEGKDGSYEWVKDQDDIDYVYSETNLGICYALNACRSLIKSPYMVYLNDDMYVLPNWDKALFDEIQTLNTKAFMLSATMIEPNNTGNSCVIVKDYGRNIQDFKEAEILKEYKNLAKPNWTGSTWPPNVMHVDLWDLVGGYSIEFSPGMYSDPDLSRKLFEAGVRTFKGIGSSMVYHFGSKSTKRIRKNTGRKMFLLKWGISARTFTTKYLQIGKPYQGELSEPQLSKTELLINKLKRMKG